MEAFLRSQSALNNRSEQTGFEQQGQENKWQVHLPILTSFVQTQEDAYQLLLFQSSLCLVAKAQLLHETVARVIFVKRSVGHACVDVTK